MKTPATTTPKNMDDDYEKSCRVAEEIRKATQSFKNNAELCAALGPDKFKDYSQMASTTEDYCDQMTPQNYASLILKIRINYAAMKKEYERLLK